jgi:hypothetical protein
MIIWAILFTYISLGKFNSLNHKFTPSKKVEEWGFFSFWEEGGNIMKHRVCRIGLVGGFLHRVRWLQNIKRVVLEAISNYTLE